MSRPITKAEAYQAASVSDIAHNIRLLSAQGWNTKQVIVFGPAAGGYGYDAIVISERQEVSDE